MQHEIPEFKTCPNCKTFKSSYEYYRNSSRKDGLTYVCISCVNDYAQKEKKPKKVLNDIQKVCVSCGRKLTSRMFVYSQKTSDHLNEKCRTCSAYRAKNIPSQQEINHYESSLREIINVGLSKFDSEKNRSELEQFVWQRLLSTGLLVKWKPPIWVHKTSLPE